MGSLSLAPSLLVAHDSPKTITGLPDADAAKVAKVIGDFMAKHQVPGVTLAMAAGGRLTLTGAFGHADLEKQVPARVEHLFRIASVSKPITSVAIFRLAEAGTLGLDHRPFARNGLLRRFYDPREQTTVNRERLEALTIQQLLEHTAGGWGNRENDPMFAADALSFNHADLIRWTLRTMALEHPPGGSYSYSNFGYCLLGRIIEAVTGRPYDAHVQEDLLKPAGITRMRLGKRERNPGDPDEVTYYGKDEDPYGDLMNVARMDAHGGWVASAVDLVRFALHVDGFPRPPDLLGEASLQAMTTPSKANPNYAKGWGVDDQKNWRHQGGFLGGSSVILRTTDGQCWAILANTRVPGTDYTRDLDSLARDIRKEITVWPEHDLFQ